MEGSELIDTLCTSSVPSFEKDKKLCQFIKTSRLHSAPDDIIDKFLTAFPGQAENSLQFQNVKLRLASTFKRSDLILNLLLDGDRHVIDKAIKLPWLYRSHESPFENVDFLITKFFPSVSYSCRLKTVNNMSKYMTGKEATVDQIFDVIQSTYGLPLAMPLLVVCSPQKTESVINSKKIVSQFSSRQLLSLAQRFEGLVYTYFEKLFDRTTRFLPGYEPLVIHQFLFDQNPAKFIKFMTDHEERFDDSALKIGQKRVVKYLELEEEFMDSHCEIFFKKFALTLPAKKRVWRKLTLNQRHNLMIKALPKDIVELKRNGQIWQWLNGDIVPDKTSQLKILKEAIFKKYGFNDFLHPDCLRHLSPEIITLLPPDQRLTAVEYNIEQKTPIKTFEEYYTPMVYWEAYDSLNWTVLKPTHVSVPEIKKLLLSEQIVYKRTEHLKALLMTCYLNADSSELLNIIKFCGDRIRNDQPEVRNHVIDFIAKILIERPLTSWTIDDGHWLAIMDIIRLSILQKEVHGAFESSRKLIGKYFILLFKKSRQNSVDFENIVQLFVKLRLVTDEYHFNEWVIPDELQDPVDQRHMLVLYLKVIQKLFPSTLTPLTKNGGHILRSVVKSIFQFNKKVVAKSKICVEPIPVWRHHGGDDAELWLIQRLDEFISSEEGDDAIYNKHRRNWSYAIVPITICVLTRGEILQNLLSNDIHFKDRKEELGNKMEKYFSQFHSEPLLTYFLRTGPEKLEQNWDQIVKENLSRAQFKSEMSVSFTKFMRLLQATGYQSLVDKTMAHCIKVVGGNVEDFEIQEKTNSIRLLSVLSNTKKSCTEFLQIVSTFYPIDKRVDPSAEGSELDLEMKTAVSASLKNLTGSVNPAGILEAIQKYCLGDYLKLVYGSLYSQCNLCPSKEAMKFLKAALISTKAVSVKKHLIRLFFTMATSQESLATAREMWIGEDNHVTSRYTTFVQISRLFISMGGGSQEAWLLLQMAVEDLKSEDKLSLDHLSNSQLIRSMLPEFLPRYVKLCLNHLKKLKDAGGENQLAGFVGQLESLIDILDEDILAWIIREDFCQFKRNFNCDVEYCRHQEFFQKKYLMGDEKNFGKNCCSEILTKRLTVVIETLTGFVENHWDDAEKADHGDDLYFKVRRATSCFILGICANGLDKILTPTLAGEAEDREKKKLVEMIFEGFLKFFESKAPLKCFKQIFNLKLALNLVTDDDGGVDTDGKMDDAKIFKNFGRSTAHLIDSTVGLYGGEIVGIISDSLNIFCNSVLPEDLRKGDNILRFLDGLLYPIGSSSSSSSIHCQIVVAKMMPRIKPSGSVGQKIWDEIHSKMDSIQDPVAHIYRWAS